MSEENGYRQWISPRARAVFLLVHGIGAHTGRWEALADFFIKNDISSYAIECPNPEDYNDGIFSLREIIVKNNPGKKIFLIGESLGGLISFTLVVRRSGLFDGLVCFSPAFGSRLKMSMLNYLKISASLLYNPGKEFKLPFDSSMCTRDEEYRKKMDSDEREHRLASSHSIVKILFMQMASWILAKKLKDPVFFLVAGDDKIVDSRVSVGIFKRLTAKDKTLIEYPGMYHALSIDLGKEKVFEDLLKWTEKRI
ncbi:MAG: alpha/beta hydrolase [Candidatus Omnitrophica bacterium]|nr:alpha/beta hydrolase [Candidatus Omnitrophota bacterium]